MQSRSGGENGIALILAILALMLLTFLGLTLAATTSTELQISSNYRMAQQALYNAEAGIEVGKAILRDVDWKTILPVARTTPWTLDDSVYDAPVPPFGAGPRDCENGNTDCAQAKSDGCDKRGAQAGYGVVFNDGSLRAQDIRNFGGFALNGTFTLWVRRPLIVDTATFTYRDCTGDPNDTPPECNAPSTGKTERDGILIMTSEGAAGGGSNRAVRIIEMILTRKDPAAKTLDVCQSRGGQAGGGPEGAGFGGCTALDEKVLGAAELNPGAK